MPIEPGQQLLHYRLIEKIGEGGMGVVWKAEDTKLGREVALKFLTATFAGDAERLARFEREARLLATLNHANVATLHGLEKVDDEHFLVLELVSGESLDERLQRGPLPVDEVLSIGRQVAEALDAAHEKGIVHRDLKPANIKITDESVVKVLDFGLAKVWEPEAVSGDPSASPTLTHQMTQAGVILGTAAYMSPEQARGRATDKRTDIWSFGCVLHELLSGRHTFSGDTVSDTIAAILKSDPDPAALPAATPPRLRELLSRCLEKDRRRRLRDIGDARAELERIEAGDTGATRVSPSMPFSRWLALAAVLALGLVLGAFLQGWRTADGAAAAESSGVRRLSILPPKGLTVQWLDFSSDGETLVYAAGRGHGTDASDVRLYQRRLDSFESTPIPESENPVWATFSPDGGHVAFLTDNADRSYSIKKVSVDGGPVVELLALTEPPGPTVANWWSENELLVVLDNRKTLARLPAGGGSPSPVLTLGDDEPSVWSWVSVLQGGRILLLPLLEASGEGILFRTDVLDLETNERRTILEGGWLWPYRDAGLIYRQRTIFGVPFDHERLELTGPEVPLWDDRTVRFGGDSTAYLPQPSASDRLILVDRSGGIEPLAEAPDKRLVDVRWSPDGRQIALLTYEPTRVHRNVWRLDVAREVMQPVPAGDAWKDSLGWMPEGGLQFGMVTEAGPYRLGRRGLRPGDAWEPLFPEWSQQTIAAGWAADGSVSAVVSMDPVSNERTMWLVFGGKDAEPRSFIEGPTQMSRPAVSPDGRAVAVASNESGAMEVYAAMISSDSTAPTLFQVSERGGRRPIWSRDGTELIFYDPGGYLMSARVRTGGQGLGFERPEVVLDLNALNLPPVYDVSPDGTRFVFAQRAPEEREAGSRIFVELGWGFEFDALMGSKD